jgi:hypothetical protein
VRNCLLFLVKTQRTHFVGSRRNTAEVRNRRKSFTRLNGYAKHNKKKKAAKRKRPARSARSKPANRHTGQTIFFLCFKDFDLPAGSLKGAYKGSLSTSRDGSRGKSTITTGLVTTADSHIETTIETAPKTNSFFLKMH